MTSALLQSTLQIWIFKTTENESSLLASYFLQAVSVLSKSMTGPSNIYLLGSDLIYNRG
jgi:hypothetical protein